MACTPPAYRFYSHLTDQLGGFFFRSFDIKYDTQGEQFSFSFLQFQYSPINFNVAAKILQKISCAWIFISLDIVYKIFEILKTKNINSRSSFNKLTYYWSVINESLDRTDNFANIAERVTSEMPKVAYEMLEFNIPPESWRNLKNEVELYSIFDYY